MEVSKNEQVFLVVGGTSRIGTIVVKSLINRNKTVRILIPNDSKLNNFTDEERSKIESITICNLHTDNDYEHKIESIFNLNDKKVTHVISCITVYHISKCNNSYYTSQSRIIEAAKKYNIQRFLMISSSHITKPYSYHSLSLNLKHHYTQWNRVRAEECLRNSGLKYLIVRAGNIAAGTEEYDYTINQGDKLEGSINVPTLGKLAIDTFLDPWLQDNITYECVTYDRQKKEKYSYVQGRFRLHPDSEEDKKKCNSVAHVRACRVIKFGLFFILSTGAFSVAYYINEQFRKWVKENITQKLLK